MSTRGSASLIAIAIAGVVVSCGLGAILVIAAHTEALRLQTIADLVALAVSDVDRGLSPGLPCAEARKLAQSMGAGVAECTVERGDATLTVASQFHGITFHKSARAAPD